MVLLSLASSERVAMVKEALVLQLEEVVHLDQLEAPTVMVVVEPVMEAKERYKEEMQMEMVD